MSLTKVEPRVSSDRVWLTEEQLKAMEASAPLLVAEVRALHQELKNLRLYLAMETVPISMAIESSGEAAASAQNATLKVFDIASRNLDMFNLEAGQVIRNMVKKMWIPEEPRDKPWGE